MGFVENARERFILTGMRRHERLIHEYRRSVGGSGRRGGSANLPRVKTGVWYNDWGRSIKTGGGGPKQWRINSTPVF